MNKFKIGEEVIVPGGRVGKIADIQWEGPDLLHLIHLEQLKRFTHSDGEKHYVVIDPLMIMICTADQLKKKNPTEVG